MKLLSTEEVKEKKRKTDEDRQKRIDKLNTEETSLTKGFNTHKSKIDAEKKLLDNHLEEYRGLILEKKKELTKEVTSLESRRDDALKPINEQKKEAEKRKQEADKKEKDIEIRENQLNEDQENLIERTENVVEREEFVEEKEKNLDTREKNVRNSEEETKKSSEVLSKNWLNYHKSVTIFNKEMEQKETDAKNQKNANEVYAKELDKKAEEQTEHDKLIKDKYETLNRTINRLNKQHGGIKIRL